MSIYWGCWISAAVTATDLDNFEGLAGKKISLLGAGGTWWNGGIYPTGTYSPIITSKATLIHGRGGLYCYDWTPGSSYNPATGTKGVDDPGFNLPHIISGTHDAYITAQANAVKALGYPILLRIFHEMNGTWYHWYYQADTTIGNGGTNSGQVIQAWRHIVDLFEAAGCTHLGPTPNVQWVFCPNNMATTGSTSENLADFYPGDDYVDWLGLDAYNFGNPWLTLQQACEGGGTTGLQNTVANLKALNPRKPIMIGETGCNDSRAGVIDGASKAQWYTDAFNTYLPSQPLIQCIIYSHYNEAPNNWRIDYPLTGSGAGLTVPAFAAPTGIGSSHYLAGNTFTPDPQLHAYWLGQTTDRFRALNKSTTGPSGALASIAGYWRAQEAVGATSIADDSGNARSATKDGTPTLAVATTVVPANTGEVSVQFAADTTSDFRLTDADVWSPVTTGSMTWQCAFILDSIPTSNGLLMGKGAVSGTQWEFDHVITATNGFPRFTLRTLTNSASLALTGTKACPTGVPLLYQARLDGSTKQMKLVVSSATGSGWGDVYSSTATWNSTLGNGTADFLLGRRDAGDHNIPGKIAHWSVNTIANTDTSWLEAYNAWIPAPIISGITVTGGSVSTTPVPTVVDLVKVDTMDMTVSGAATYGTFDCTSQHICSNANGIFFTYLHSDSTTTGDDVSNWRLVRSTDNGATWTTLANINAANAKTPMIETDENNDVYVFVSSMVDNGSWSNSPTYLYKFLASASYAVPTPTTNISASAGKACTMYDQARGRLYYLTWGAGGTSVPQFWALDKTGAVVTGFPKQLWSFDANMYPMYSLMTLGSDGTLIAAWTNQDISAPNGATEPYYDDRFIYSSDGGVTWTGTTGTLTLPFSPIQATVADGTKTSPSWLITDAGDIAAVGTNQDNFTNQIALNGGYLSAVYDHAASTLQVGRRFNMSTLAFDKDFRPITGATITPDQQGGGYVQDTSGSGRLFYVAGSATGGTAGHVGIIYSDDHGGTWTDAVTTAKITTVSQNSIYALGTCRQVKADGSLIGCFTLCTFGASPADIYFFRAH